MMLYQDLSLLDQTTLMMVPNSALDKSSVLGRSVYKRMKVFPEVSHRVCNPPDARRKNSWHARVQVAYR